MSLDLNLNPHLHWNLDLGLHLGFYLDYLDLLPAFTQQEFADPVNQLYQDIRSQHNHPRPWPSPFPQSQVPNGAHRDAINPWSREFALLDKIYRDEDRFSETRDTFNFKIIVFRERCRRVGFPPEAYTHGASKLISGQAQLFYGNASI